MMQKECYSSMSNEDTAQGQEMEQSSETTEGQVEGSEGESSEEIEEGVEGEKEAITKEEPTTKEDPQYVAPLPIEGGAVEAGNMEEGTLAGGKMPGVSKEPLLSHMTFIIGITVLTFFVGAFLGGFLARRKIKKGIEIYED